MKNEVMSNGIIIEKIKKEVKRIEESVDKEFKDFCSRMLSSTEWSILHKVITTKYSFHQYFCIEKFSKDIMKEVHLYENDNKKLMSIYNSLLGMHTDILDKLYDEHHHFDLEKFNINSSKDIFILIKYTFFD